VCRKEGGRQKKREKKKRHPSAKTPRYEKATREEIEKGRGSEIAVTMYTPAGTTMMPFLHACGNC
jgi:hypothetical protein